MEDNITWKFIPSSFPHFGDLWGAAVKSCKYHLIRVMGSTHLAYEECETLLIQVEATLNSNPLYSVSSDPNDLLPITPSYFLKGRTPITVPDPDVSELKCNRLSRFQLLLHLNQSFWKKWSNMLCYSR